MAKKLTSYEAHHTEILEQLALPELIASGVACPETKSSIREKDCPGEMMIFPPGHIEHRQHESLKRPDGTPLQRARCNQCNWKGWV